MGTSSKTGQEKQSVENFSTRFEENLYKDLYEKLKRDFEEKLEQEKEKSDRAVDKKKLESRDARPAPPRPDPGGNGCPGRPSPKIFKNFFPAPKKFSSTPPRSKKRLPRASLFHRLQEP